MITFDGVVAMADAVGGVEVCLATPIVDTDVSPALDLQAGNQELSGPRPPPSSALATVSATGATSAGSATSRRSCPPSPGRRCPRAR